MEKQFYNILNPIHQEVMAKPIDQYTYNLYIKNIRLDRSPASLARIKESLLMSRDQLTEKLIS